MTIYYQVIHNFEHFPNLIKSLNSLSKILTPDGKIIAFIPDCRFEFDRFRNITKVSKILADFYQNKKPSLEELFENRLYYCIDTSQLLLETHNNNNNI